jgi:hypothetical protein
MTQTIEVNAREWIVGYLRNECGVTEEIRNDRPIFEYLDSFGAVGFFLACEEQFPDIDGVDPGAFTGVDIDEAARIIAEKLALCRGDIARET